MDSVEISVRTPFAEDARHLAEIHIAAWRAAYRGVMTDEYLDGLSADRAAATWRSSIEAPEAGTQHLLAAAGGRPVGFAIFGPASGDYAPAAGQLHAINVHPEWWSRGVGSALFAAAERGLAELGCFQALLWVEAGNNRARDFYTRHGWASDGGIWEDNRFDPPLSEVRYRRVFSSPSA